nr:MAG TPA: Major capsid protein [Microviridae sp.]
MGKQPFISHAVNGYSRYDVPESKAFTCTPGILYPVRIDFINARDRVSIEQGIDVRSNPLAVPTFNPYTIRLHRFWVPLQLYHPEMRTNSSKFDMNDLSLNFVAASSTGSYPFTNNNYPYSNSLLRWLRIIPASIPTPTSSNVPVTANLTTAQLGYPLGWCNADSYLAYWDIVRNYYSYSQWGLYSFAWPGSWWFIPNSTGAAYNVLQFGENSSFFSQRYGNLEFLDAYFESQFYPSAVTSSNNTYNRGNLFSQILLSDLGATITASKDGYPVSTIYPGNAVLTEAGPATQFATVPDTARITTLGAFLVSHPMAVVPSNPDRYSRLLPVGSSAGVSMSGVTTIPQLAIASRLQEYKDLLGAGGSRYSDWLETFFASKIEHVDRPKLLFSASQTVNVQVVMNQAGSNNFQGDNYSMPPLGQQGGAVAFNDRLGRRQSYYFREPGYMIDMLSIRPVYYWAGIYPDYLHYTGADYFNPIYNDIGYQDIPGFQFGFGTTSSTEAVAYEPCFNEFRSSYDEVLGQLSFFQGQSDATPLYAYWVQQRVLSASYNKYYSLLFVDIGQVNSPFISNVEDNFFINLSYSVQKKNLVNKTFATRLSNR